MKILVVDDDEDNAELLGNLLERQGWTVVIASSLEEGRRALREGEFRVLITDLYLPDGIGLSLLEPEPPAYPCVAILVTGALDEPLRRKSKALGFHRCFPKPLSASELTSAIHLLTRDPGGASP